VKHAICDHCGGQAYLEQTGTTVDSLLEYQWSKYHCSRCKQPTYRIDDVRWTENNNH